MRRDVGSPILYLKAFSILIVSVNSNGLPSVNKQLQRPIDLKVISAIEHNYDKHYKSIQIYKNNNLK